MNPTFDIAVKFFAARKHLTLFRITALLLSFATFTTLNASADTYIVQNTFDTGSNSLRAHIASAAHGDTIRFNPSLLSGGSDTIKFASVINIAKRLTIVGLYNSNDTLFISGQNKCQLFHVDFYQSNLSNQTVLFDSLILIEAVGGYGGAIRFMFGDSLQVSRSVLKENNGSLGGGIYTYQTKAILKSCMIHHNTASSGGGVFFDFYNNSSNSIKILNSQIHDNYANKGGGVYISTSGSYSTQNGDAFLTVMNTSIYNNDVSQKGGGIYVFGEQDLSILMVNTNISNNSASSFAGGAYVWSDHASTNMKMEGCTVSNNYANGNGAGIFFWNNLSGILNVSNSTFANNSSIGSGGAIYVYSNDDTVDLYFLNDTFYENKATASGGGVYVYVDYTTYASDIRFDSCLFEDNSAQNTGGAFSCQVVSGDTFEMKVSNSTFNRNSCTQKRGGAIWCSARYTGRYLFSKNQFRANTASENGGAISLETVGKIFFNSTSDTFQFDSAQRGGAIHLTAYQSCFASFDKSLFHGNDGTHNGGALYVFARDTIADIITHNSTFSNNFAKVDGGGIFCSSYAGTSRVTLNGSTFNENLAQGNGGAVYSYGEYFQKIPTSEVYSYACTFSENHAANGGAIHGTTSRTNNKVEIINSTLYKNTATTKGNAIFCSSYSALNVGSSIIANDSSTNIYHNRPVNSLGYNVFSDSMAGVDTLDFVYVNATLLNLDSLAFNGGFTKTHIPITRSIAIDNGNPLDTTFAQNGMLYGHRDIGASENFCNSRRHDSTFSCDSFIWKSKTFKDKQMHFRDTFTNISGCDSINHLHVTLNFSTFKLDTIETCDSFTWSGKSYYPGMYTFNDSLLTFKGCDSITSIYLKINQSVYSNDTIASIDSIIWDNIKYTEDTDSLVKHLNTSKGCDSTVYVKLYILKSSMTIDSFTACDSFTWRGKTFFSSNYTAKDTLIKSNGADSILALKLTLFHSINRTDSISSCRFYIRNSVTFIRDTSFIETFSTINGCDSVINFEISILNVNTTISRSGDTLIAPEGKTSYLWLDCALDYDELPSETSNKYKALTTGEYAVRIEENTCIDTSECLLISNLSIQAINTSPQILIYPNPSSGTLYLKNTQSNNKSLDVKVYDGFGRLIIHEPVIGSLNKIVMPSNAVGMHFIHITLDGHTETHEVIIE